MTEPGRSSGARRSRRHDRVAIGASLLVAAVVHAAVVGGAGATGLFASWGGMAAGADARVDATDPSTPVAPLRPSCDGDAILAVAARALTCASPFVDDRGACVDELGLRLESDRLRCHLEDLTPVAFTLDRIDVRELPQLDPEPLLEMLAQQETPPPPPPLPPPPAPAEEQVAAPQPRPEPPKIVRETQVIETAKPTVEQAPDDTRLLSEYDTKVARQTVARGSNREEIAARPQPAELAVKEEPREPSVAEPPDDSPPGQNPDAPRVPGMLSMRQPGAPNPTELAQDAHDRGVLDGSDAPVGDGRAAARGDGRISMEERRPAELPRGDGGAGGGRPPTPNLRASQEVLERAIGGGSVDHLDDVDEGDETALNSKQFRYATFFNRMKRRVHQNWDPISVWHRNDPGGTVYGTRTRTTRLRITLGPAGDVKKIIVISPSGADFLDDEAIRAFRAAQPFPNPPTGLIDATGLISFTFGFNLEIGANGRSTWKIFRSM